jgi:hypothetical protein
MKGALTYLFAPASSSPSFFAAACDTSNSLTT